MVIGMSAWCDVGAVCVPEGCGGLKTIELIEN